MSLILEKHDWIFQLNQEVELLKIYESIWCFIAQLLVFLWFAYSVNQNCLMWPKMFCMLIIVILFFSQNLSNVVTVKHFVLVIFIIISDTCPRITLRWYKTILNQVEWTCKVKKQNKPFLTITHHFTPKWILLSE